MQHHAFVIPAEAEKGIEIAEAWVQKELGMETKANPDVITFCHGLLSVEDARRISELAAQAPFQGDSKVLIIAASRAYHEAQNALLKLFEEPPPGTYLFFILPTLGGLLSTLHSRVQVLNATQDVRRPTSDVGRRTSYMGEAATEFLKATKEKRSAIIKKLTSGKDEEERRELRDEAIAIVNGIESVSYSYRSQTSVKHTMLLSDIAVLRSYLYDRSAPVRMILEHLSLVIPKNLL